MTANIDAWTSYWKQFRGPAGTCLPTAGDAVERLLQDHWRSVASSLPPNARVVDLACGSGTVGRYIRSIRQDCTLVGVDSASISATGGMELHSGVSIENMPFADASFDAAVSQFGFEYANAGRAARELARVLRPGAQVAMIVHHARGPIVAHNVERDGALAAIAGPAIGQPFKRGDASILEDEFGQLASRFERQDIVTEFANGLRSALDLPADARANLWEDLLGKIDMERSIIASLRLAAVDDLQQWGAVFDGQFERTAPGIIANGPDEPIAWVLMAFRN